MRQPFRVVLQNWIRAVPRRACPGDGEGYRLPVSGMHLDLAAVISKRWSWLRCNDPDLEWTA
jgi:hypothetical protein